MIHETVYPPKPPEGSCCAEAARLAVESLTDDELKEIVIKRCLHKILDTFVGQPNTEQTRNLLTLAASSFITERAPQLMDW